MDCEASQAAKMGGPLLCFGLVVRDASGQLTWFNQAHLAFTATFICREKNESVAFCGVSEDGRLYVNMVLGHSGHSNLKEVESFASLLLANPPTKDTVSVARMSRTEMAQRMAAGQVTRPDLVAELKRVPEYVEYFSCRALRRKAASGFSVSWDEPSAPPAMMN